MEHMKDLLNEDSSKKPKLYERYLMNEVERVAEIEKEKEEEKWKINLLKNKNQKK